MKFSLQKLIYSIRKKKEYEHNEGFLVYKFIVIMKAIYFGANLIRLRTA